MRSPTLVPVLGIGLVTFFAPAAAHAERCSDGTRYRDSAHDEDREREGEPPPHPGARDAQPPREDCIERDIVMMPGVFTTYFAPNGNYGSFVGAGVQFAPYQWSHNNDHFGPSQGGVIMQAALLKSPRSSGTLSLYEIGMNASFERNSSRRYLIPYFGGNIGALTNSDLGTSLYGYPYGGVHLYYHRNLMVDAEGGYHFPFTNIDEARGPRAQLAARFTLW